MATYTCSVYENWQPKAAHAGVNVVSGEYSDAAGTAGSRVLLAKIPHGATIVGGQIKLNGDGEWQLGTSESNSGLIAQTSATTGDIMLGATGVGAPFNVSVSDDKVDRWTTLLIDFVSVSFSCSPLKFNVFYTMDNPT